MNITISTKVKNAKMEKRVKKELAAWDDGLKYKEFHERLAQTTTVTITGNFTDLTENLYREVAETVLFELGNVAKNKEFRKASNIISKPGKSLGDLGTEFATVEAKQMIVWGRELKKGYKAGMASSTYGKSQLETCDKYEGNDIGFISHFNTDRGGHGIGKTRVDGDFSPTGVTITIKPPAGGRGEGGGGEAQPNTAEMYAVGNFEDAGFGKKKACIKSLGKGGQWDLYVAALVDLPLDNKKNVVLAYDVAGAIGDGIFPKVTVNKSGPTIGMVNYAVASNKSTNILFADKNIALASFKTKLTENYIDKKVAESVATKFVEYAVKNPLSKKPIPPDPIKTSSV